MVLAVPPESWDEFSALCDSEGVEATVIGQFVPTGRLRAEVSRPAGGRPGDGVPARRPAAGGARGGLRAAGRIGTAALPEPASDYTPTLLKILGSLNVASKEWVIRQYDHEVQGGSVVKPLVGVANDGPERRGRGAAGARSSRRGIVVACGMNPRYGDFDTYHMAASAIDEAVRNCVAVGADPRRIAILDNFCWGDYRPARNARLAGPRGAGLPRRGHRAGHAVHQRQGQPEQRIPLHRRPTARRSRSPFRRRC